MTEARYDHPAAWAAGPDRVYGELARAAVALLPASTTGEVALDAGTGTGAFARALLDRGYRVISTDVSVPMLRYHRADRDPVIAADIVALPLRDQCVDTAVAGFVLSHVSDPVRGMAELVRVARPGGTVLVTAFPAGPTLPTHPVKAAVDTVLKAYGYQPPDWYLTLRGPGEERVGSVSALSSVAAAAGVARAEIERVEVDLGGLGTGVLVAWRMGMAQVVPWLATLDRTRRIEVADAALAELDRIPLTPLPMLVLHARVAP